MFNFFVPVLFTKKRKPSESINELTIRECRLIFSWLMAFSTNG